MRTLFRHATFLASLAIVPIGAQEELASPAAGFLRTDCPGGSDTRTSAPFHPVLRWRGPLDAAPVEVVPDTFRLGFTLPTEIAAGELIDSPHFLFCREPSLAEGIHFPIVAHAANSIDIEAEAASLAGLALGAMFEIMPAWTLDSLFPPGEQDTFHLSDGRLATGRGSELLFFNRESEGILLAPARRFYITSGGWFEVGEYSAAGDTVLPPGIPFVVRHQDGAQPSQYVAMQQVYASPVQMEVRATDGKRQDTDLAPLRPVPIALADLDIAPIHFEESPDTTPANRRDELLVFDNTAVAINKSPAAVFFRSGGEWIEDAPGFPDADLVKIEPSAGILVRKAEGTGDLVLSWSNAPAYDPEAP